MAVPWAAAVRLGLYNVRQASALTELGAPTRLFALSPRIPAALAALHPTLRRFRNRPTEYEFEGVPVRTVRGWMPPRNLIRRHLYGWSPGGTARLLRWGFARRLDVAVEVHQPEVVMAHNGPLLGDLARAVAGRRGIPYALIEHSVLSMPARSRAARRYLEVARDARAVFLVGRRSYEWAVGELGLENAHLIVNGATLPSQPQRQAPRPQRWRGKRVVLCAGAFTQQKGQSELLQAFARAAPADAMLVFVGAAPDWFRAQVRDLGLEGRVEILPNMPQSELLQLMVWADLFALPSWGEAFGLVYVESMGAGTAVIMTDDNGVRPYITSGEHGWVVPPRDVEALAEALREALLEADLERMGQAGRALVEGRFTWRSNAEQMLEALAGEPGGGRRDDVEAEDAQAGAGAG